MALFDEDRGRVHVMNKPYDPDSIDVKDTFKAVTLTHHQMDATWLKAYSERVKVWFRLR